MEPENFIKILPQPDDSTCGPTSLHAVYRFYNLELELEEVIESVSSLDEGGTLAVMLGIDALRRGFGATIFSYNLKMFDPTWHRLPNDMLIELLDKQLSFKKGKKFEQATRAYQHFLSLGGELRFDDMNVDILTFYFRKNIPVLTGLSATYLYNSKREYTNNENKSVYDDIKGVPMGHFVVLCGMNGNKVKVADPYKGNPISGNNYYEVGVNRLLNSILLGIVTYDANMLMVFPTT